MGRIAGMFGLLFILGCSAQPARTVTETDPQLAMDEASARLRSGDWGAADRLLKRAIESPGFSRLPEALRYEVLKDAAEIAANLGDNPRAQLLWTQASAFPLSDQDTWHRRLAAAYAVDDAADSAYCLLTIARRWPSTLEWVRNQAVFKVAEDLKNDASSKKLHFELLDNLFEADWKGGDVQRNGLWVDLVALWLERGNTMQAARVVERIDSARSVLAMRIDRRFDGITRSRLEHFDVEGMARKEIMSARFETLNAPSLLEPRVRLQRLLLDALQFDEALAIADDVTEMVGDGDGAAIYSDFVDEYAWILDQRSIALQRLGRWDEAVLQLRRAARRPEQGGLNVSQALNLGLLYAELGHSEDALDAVSDLGPLSPYGRMQLERVRLMVAVQLGDHDAVASHLAFMRDHRTDALGTYQTVLLDAARADEASALLVERLRSERFRSEALIDIQMYVDVPVPAWVRKRNALLRTVVARPEVQRELATVGRIEHVGLAHPGG